MSDPALHRLVYQSRSALTGSEQTVERALAELVEQSHRNNARDGVTGALMCCGGGFLQVLEGEAAALEHVFERICCDLRHLEVQLIEFVPTGRRGFGEWGLQRVRPDMPLQALLAQLDGLNAAGDGATVSEAVRLMAVLADLGPVRAAA